jgi:hypothetical protein
MSESTFSCGDCRYSRDAVRTQDAKDKYLSEIDSLEADIATCGIKAIITGKKSKLEKQLVDTRFQHNINEMQMFGAKRVLECPGPVVYEFVESAGSNREDTSPFILQCGVAAGVLTHIKDSELSVD